MVNSARSTGGNDPEVPDYAAMRRTMLEVGGEHVMDGLVCPNPSCSGTLQHDRGRVSCTTCGGRIDIGSRAPTKG